MNRLALVLLAAAIVFLAATLAAVAAGKLARLDGATYPAALSRSAAVFAAFVTLAATLSTTLTQRAG